jgi:uncharacterized protein (TIGR01244 family)
MRKRTVISSLVLSVAAIVAGVMLYAVEPEKTGIPNATSPAPGILFGGQPTAEQLQQLAADDYKTVIDLRAPNEDRGYDEPAAAKAAGLAYVPIPVTEESLEDPKTLDRFIEVFNQSDKPVLVHCTAGGRVAAVYYAWLVSEKKMSRQDALAAAKGQGLRRETLIPTIDEYLDRKKDAKQ